MTYRFIWEETGVVAKFSGHTNSFEAAEMLSVLSDDARFPNLRWRINDFLDVISHETNETPVKNIDALNSVNLLANANCLTAVVVKRLDIAEIVSDLIKRHPKPNNVAMFDTQMAARKWIESLLSV